ncbi:MAG TPA: hypothetical protein DEF88_10270 [Porphyromonadaceae bacterium]|jgi:hypothetical protein|nr:hypothetical protein [Porphyromonadaceae bacterium]HBX20817.1 hypothetical protein [Porphyromonadaceae bacterium]HCM20130.1 hypothetical protein [Porphyromonadaceae bacterium]
MSFILRLPVLRLSCAASGSRCDSLEVPGWLFELPGTISGVPGAFFDVPSVISEVLCDVFGVPESIF